jgi:hypothetical protein
LSRLLIATDHVQRTLRANARQQPSKAEQPDGGLQQQALEPDGGVASL